YISTCPAPIYPLSLHDALPIYLAGLISGPVHAEMRVNEQGAWLLEIAARSIGGLCGRMLRHALGMSLEELILRHALDRPLPLTRHNQATGVMMIPVPGRRSFHRGPTLRRPLQVAHRRQPQIPA